MRALTASSKLNGCSDTGFALGINPHKKANGIDRFFPYVNAWTCSSAETVAREASSASCYYRLEDIRILSVVVPERKLRKIKRQIILTHLVVGSDDATLQERPEGVNVRRVNITSNIFMGTMVHGFMWIVRREILVAVRFIGSHKSYVATDCLSHEAVKRFFICTLDHLTNDIPFAGDRADDRNLISGSAPFKFLVPMAVLIFPADVGFINLYLSHELRKTRIPHRGADSVAHIPSGPVISTSNLPVNLKGADSLFALRHQVNDLEPSLKRIIRVLKNRLSNDRETIAVSSAAILIFTNPMEGASLKLIYFLAIASWAAGPVRPAHLFQELLAGLLRGEALHQLSKRHSGLRGQRLSRLCFCVHVKKHNTSRGGCQAQHNYQTKTRPVIPEIRLHLTGLTSIARLSTNPATPAQAGAFIDPGPLSEIDHSGFIDRLYGKK